MPLKPTLTVQSHSFPCGELWLGSYGGRLCLCSWAALPHHSLVERRLTRLLKAEAVEGTSEVIDLARRQLDEYFALRRRAFSVPLLTVGTDFQRRVWRALLTIPYGETLSYARLAARVGSPLATRAAASACGANALSILIPCHRVTGSDGSLTGYGGGLDAKRTLLCLERRGSVTPI
ncbi:MAG: methylated-DNA--[protein]-cysteine S-methyltransferase [Prevotellaceae bacterium]|nr:methylated-DNA--[protein]-cysteine S-methyltransferase [Prevotellaceae bacterium]